MTKTVFTCHGDKAVWEKLIKTRGFTHEDSYLYDSYTDKISGLMDWLQGLKPEEIVFCSCVMQNEPVIMPYTDKQKEQTLRNMMIF